MTPRRVERGASIRRIDAQVSAESEVSMGSTGSTGLMLLTVVGAIGLILVLAFLWGIGVYNALQRLRIRSQGAWSDIDVQLKRRHDLIPNLVETVKGYATHEKETLEAVMAARSGAMSARGPAESGAAEGMLTAALGRLFAVAEAYPDLKANQNFLQLQQELGQTENAIGFSRQNYNRAVGDYNEQIAVFPASIVAGLFNFEAGTFFEVADPAQREAPKVRF
jgi:LemA protein